MVEIKSNYENGIDVITLKNDAISVDVTNYGCTIMKIVVNDKDNNPVDVVLGYDSPIEYGCKGGEYFGALVGRVANRIAKGNFTLNGNQYTLPINNGPNSLHGGIDGFSYRVFDYELIENGVKFHYVSKDGEEGYPGTLDLYATYTINGASLKLHYEATTDQDTLINITNHSYFNLSGKPSNIDAHYMQIQADKMGCVDPDGLATGELVDVTGTPFDFREMKCIKDQIYTENEQITLARGYDHPFIFNTDKDQVTLYCEETGIEMTVSTSLPQTHIYTANYLVGKLGKGIPMNERGAVCVETQNMPDSIHNEKNPTVILKKGDTYDEYTEFRFGVKK
ncbi:MAG: galactose mutarotase [Holdemanella sp.]|nr:galactose mutarotase [Holdemanella sp.]